MPSDPTRTSASAPWPNWFLPFRVSGFSMVRNGVLYDYPFLESFRSLLPLVDELVINVGYGDDTTWERLTQFAKQEGQGKIRLFQSHWHLDDPERRKGGQILAEQTNLALAQCSHDWCIYLQADEILHQEEAVWIRQALLRAHHTPEAEGLVFDYLHFYGSYDVIQHSRSAYRKEVRAIRKSSGATSVGDAQSFRKKDGSKLKVIDAEARIFHYGWVRNPQAMKDKTFFMDSLYHGQTPTQNQSTVTGENYRYKRFWGLQLFRDTHPAVMQPRILEKNWAWDFEHSPFLWQWSDTIKVLLDTVEKWTGLRLFEYRAYRRIPSTPFASLLLSTFNMPEHLALVLEGLRQQTTSRFEILLCDDGSDSKTRDIVQTYQTQLKIPLIHLWQENKGFRKCRILNEGLRRSQGDLFIFLDGDCVPHSHFIEDHLTQSRKGHYLAGRRVEIGPKLARSISIKKIQNGYFNYPKFSLIWSMLTRDSENLQRTIRIPVAWLRKKLGMNRIADLKGCNFSVHRAVLMQIGGFDERYEGYGREDTDLEIRLQNFGLKIRSLKGLALQFHIWHPRREFTPQNDTFLEEVRTLKLVAPKQGIEKLNEFH